MRWLGAVGIALLFAASTFTFADPDLWGHLRFGLDIIQAKALSSVDPYSFTQDQAWINHEWLSEVLMGLAYLGGGSAGLALLKGLVITAAWLVVLMSWRGVDLGPRIVLVAAVAAGTARLAFTQRPQVWSLLLFAILCSVLAASETRSTRWLPAMFVLWANLHGGWILGLGVAATWGAGAWWAGIPNARRSIGITAASVAATLLTPYGWHLWAFIAATVRMGRNITEWQPLLSSPPANWAVWGVTAMAAAWTLWRSERVRVPIAAVFAMLAYSSWRVERLVPFFVVATAVLAAPVVRTAWPARPVAPVVSSGDKRLLAGFFIAAVGAALWIMAVSLTCIPVRGSWVPDREAAALLRLAPPGRLVVFFDWGQYAIWHLAPRLLVSIDGRRETVYSDRQLANHDAVLAGTAAGLQKLADWRAEYVWLPANSMRTKHWLEEHGYRVEMSSERSFVAVRSDIPRLSDGGDQQPAPRCFPQ